MGVILRDEYGGDIPRTVKEMCKLPGMGKKMSFLCVAHAWGEAEGIGVDVHVHRICDLLGWTKGAKKPEDTRVQLERWLPKNKWVDINTMLVGLGQTVCKSKKPSCEECMVREYCKVGR